MVVKSSQVKVSFEFLSWSGARDEREKKGGGTGSRKPLTRTIEVKVLNPQTVRRVS